MKRKYVWLKTTIFLFIVLTVSSSFLTAQKKPASIDLDIDADDMQICAAQSIVEANSRKTSGTPLTTPTPITTTNNSRYDNLRNSQFCVLYRAYYYNLNSGNLNAARDNRNDMIDLVTKQADLYFDQHVARRTKQIKTYETLLDFLRIGGELAITIMNGERAKTIIGATLGSLDTGRIKFDKNFQILGTQALINSMRAKRLEKLTEITVGADKPVSAPRKSDSYSWLAARKDLQQYFLLGTFNNSAHTLLDITEKAVAQETAKLNAVSKKNVADARNADDVLATFNKALSGSQKETADATTALQSIVIKLAKNKDIAPLLTANNPSITSASTGKQILDALIAIRGNLTVLGNKDDLIIEIDQAIIDAN